MNEFLRTIHCSIFKKWVTYQLENYHLEENVMLLGTIKNPFPYYAQCDLYVQTSLHEGYCISLAEAQAFSKPIVSTDVAGARDLLTNKDREMIVGFDDNSLFEAIVRFMNSNHGETLP